VETDRLRGENSDVTRELAIRKNAVFGHMASMTTQFMGQNARYFKQIAFLGLQKNRTMTQVCVRPKTERQDPKKGTGRRSAWLWLRKRGLIKLWHRVTLQEQKDEVLRKHTDEVTQCRAELERVTSDLDDTKSRLSEKNDIAVRELANAERLRSELQQSRGQVAEMQANMKDCYVRQFEEVVERQGAEEALAELTKVTEHLRSENERLQQTLSLREEEITENMATIAERERQLCDARGELAAAETVINDVSRSKCEGLKRFFEKHDLAAVILALLRKILQLQRKAREGPGSAFASAKSLRASFSSRETLTGVDEATSSTSSLNISKEEGSQRISLSQSVIDLSLESEIRKGMLGHGGNKISRTGFQSYVESLNLTHVSSSMVVQTVLLLLGIDLSEACCDVSRFAALLALAPSWGGLDFATSQWGAVSESAAACVSARRRSSISVRMGTPGHRNSVSVLTTSPRASICGSSRRSLSARDRSKSMSAVPRNQIPSISAPTSSLALPAQ